MSDILKYVPPYYLGLEDKDLVAIDYIPGSHGVYLGTLLNDVMLTGKYINPFVKWNGCAHHGMYKDGDKFIAVHSAVYPSVYERFGKLPKVTIQFKNKSSMIALLMLALLRTSLTHSLDVDKMDDAMLQEFNPVTGKYRYGWGDILYRNISGPISRSKLRNALVHNVAHELWQYYESFSHLLFNDKSLATFEFETFYSEVALRCELRKVQSQLSLVSGDDWQTALTHSYNDFKSTNPVISIYREAVSIVDLASHQIKAQLPPMHIGTEALVISMIAEQQGIMLQCGEEFFTNTAQIIEQLHV